MWCTHCYQFPRNCQIDKFDKHQSLVLQKTYQLYNWYKYQILLGRTAPHRK